MLRSRTGAVTRLSALAAIAALGCLAGAQTASAHAGGSNCSGDLAEITASYQGTCDFPFQGYPIGMAAKFEPSTTDPTPRFSEIHVEVLLKPAFGTPQALSMECYDPAPADGAIPKVTGTTRCKAEFNSPQADQQFTLLEPIPTEIVALECSAHSHAKFSRLHPPSGKFACWSTNEARQDLEADGVMEEIGYAPGEGGGGEEPGPSPLDSLPATGLSSVITSVPYNTYAPDTVPVVRSQGLRYVNADTARHDVVASDATRPDGSAEWCGHYESGECPLFWTPLIPGSGTETAVKGIEDAEPGTYNFFCTIHPTMVGKLEVVS